MNAESALHLFGKSSFRPMQREIMEAVLEGKASIGVLPTGSGKSLCYQLPSMLIDGVSIVVSPLIALMKDQVDALANLGFKAARFDSTLTEEERFAVLADIVRNKVKLVFVAPESLDSEAFAEAFSQARPGLFVIDEAHCLSEWGQSFRPDYLALPQYAKTRNFHSVLALTATATPRVVRDLADMFDVERENIFVLPPTRTNIARVVAVPEDKMALLTKTLRKPENIPSIVYVRTRKDAEEISGTLNREGIRAKSYHAGMPAETRSLVQGEYLRGDIPVLVATIAFGMGIDKPDVRSVVHYHPPSSPESYVQESGRAGRDGAPSKSFVFFDHSDAVAARNRLLASIPDRESIRMVLARLLRPGKHVVSFYETTTSCDIAEPVLQRILFELIEKKYVSVTSKGFKYYRIKPLFPISTILSGRSCEESALLSWLDEHRDAAVEDFAPVAGMEWKDACDYLQDLALTGEWQSALRQASIELRTATREETSSALAERISTEFEARFHNDWKRLETIEHFLLQSPCINTAIDSYFGFDTAPCGHCSPCVNMHSTGSPEQPSTPPIAMETLEAIQKLSQKGKRELERATQMTRFLLGLPGPAALSGRLWAHPLYGSLSGFPWSDVLAAAQAITGK